MENNDTSHRKKIEEYEVFPKNLCKGNTGLTDSALKSWEIISEYMFNNWIWIVDHNKIDLEYGIIIHLSQIRTLIEDGHRVKYPSIFLKNVFGWKTKEINTRICPFCNSDLDEEWHSLGCPDYNNPR